MHEGADEGGNVFKLFTRILPQLHRKWREILSNITKYENDQEACIVDLEYLLGGRIKICGVQ